MRNSVWIFIILTVLNLGSFRASAGMETRGSRLGLVYLNPQIANENILNQHFERIQQIGFARIVIPLWGCQPDPVSNEVGACQIFPIETFFLQARVAKARGLLVSFLPIVGTPNGEWRGVFKPTDSARWFETYGKWIESVAIEAQRLEMHELVVGTEFSAFLFNQTENWKSLLRRLRPHFRGRLLVTTNWDHPDFKFWSEADAFGISAYFPLAKEGVQDTAQLLKGAIKNRDAMKAMARRAGKPLHVTEFGFASLSTAQSKPWYYVVPGDTFIVDLQLQAKCLEAFLKSWASEAEETRPLAMNVWATSEPEKEYSRWGFEILGKPAQAIIQSYLDVFRPGRRPAAFSTLD